MPVVPYPVRQLAALCDDRPLTPKILLAPSLSAGYDLTTKLAAAGTRWTNLRVSTPMALALDETGPERSRLGVRRLSLPGARQLVQMLLQEWPVEQRRYFPAAPDAGEGGLARSLQATIESLRLAEITPEHVEHINNPRAHDIATLYGRYIACLRRNCLWDTADVLGFAATAPSEHAPETVWIVCDETPLPAVAASWLQARAGESVWRLGRTAYGIPAPTGLAAAALPHSAIPGRVAPRPTGKAKGSSRRRRSSAGDLVQGDLFLDTWRDQMEDSPSADLFSGTSRADESVDVAPAGRVLLHGLDAAQDMRMDLCQTIGLETEIRTVLRHIHAQGIPYDAVELIFTHPTPYLGLLADAVARWDLPATFSAGIPLSATPIGSQVLSFLGWIAGGLDGRDLAARLRVAELPLNGQDLPPAASIARWLLQGRAGTGLRDILQALTAERLPDLRSTGQAHLEATREAITALIEPAAAAGDRAELIDAVLHFVDSTGSTGPARDSLRHLLQDLASLPAPVYDVGAQARDLANELRGRTLPGSVAKPGHVHITPLQEAGYTGRARMFIIGMDESHFPGSPIEDALLLDAERRSLSNTLPLPGERARTAVFHLVRVLGAAADRVTVIHSNLHLADGREPYASPLYERLRRTLRLTPSIETPVPATTPCDELEALLQRRQRPGVTQALITAYPGVGAGLAAGQARAQAAPSRFSGWLGQPDVERLDIKGSRVLSSRMLEMLAECPRRYLFAYGLRLRPADEPSLDPRRWLNPLEIGQLLHDLFLRFMQELADTGQRPSSEHQSRLDELIDEAIAQHQIRVPVVLEAAYRADRRRIERAAHIFLHAEAQRLGADPNVEPTALELEFGADNGVEIRLSHDVAFRLRGRIDRVDAVRGAEQTSAYEVWDYKTGSTFHFDASDLLRGGRILQWALYAYALPQVVGDDAPVRTSGYFFASDRGAGQRFHDAPPARHELAILLEPLFALAQEGYFPALHKQDARGGGPCRFCDYRRVCAPEARGAADVEPLVAAAEHLSGLVEGWADVAAQGRSGSQQSIESTLSALGLQPGDVAPASAAHNARRWIQA